jgi:hypothetical protein
MEQGIGTHYQDGWIFSRVGIRLDCRGMPDIVEE